jgi:hypothetical protein
MEQGFGERCLVDLLPAGARIPVTQGNVSHYCVLHCILLFLSMLQVEMEQGLGQRCSMDVLPGGAIVSMTQGIMRPYCNPDFTVPSFPMLQVEMEQGFGERCSVDLLPGGANIPVSQGNVSHYCELYAQHLLVHSIHKQFAAFHRGFLRLCSGAALQLFRCAGCCRGGGFGMCVCV